MNELKNHPNSGQPKESLKGKDFKIVGYSESEKDTYWTVYQIKERYFIGLCDDEDWCWEVSKDGAGNYKA